MQWVFVSPKLAILELIAVNVKLIYSMDDIIFNKWCLFNKLIVFEHRLNHSIDTSSIYEQFSPKCLVVMVLFPDAYNNRVKPVRPVVNMPVMQAE